MWWKAGLFADKKSRGKSGRDLNEKSRELSEKSPLVDGPLRFMIALHFAFMFNRQLSWTCNKYVTLTISSAYTASEMIYQFENETFLKKIQKQPI